jgi:hypothetical protein
MNFNERNKKQSHENIIKKRLTEHSLNSTVFNTKFNLYLN